MYLERHQENRRKRQRQKSGNPELVQPVLHRVLRFLCDYDSALQIAPIRNLRERSMNGFLIGQAFCAEAFVRFFQVAGKFRVHFFLLIGIKCEAVEVSADDFLPIRHGPPFVSRSQLVWGLAAAIRKALQAMPRQEGLLQEPAPIRRSRGENLPS